MRCRAFLLLYSRGQWVRIILGINNSRRFYTNRIFIKQSIWSSTGFHVSNSTVKVYTQSITRTTLLYILNGDVDECTVECDVAPAGRVDRTRRQRVVDVGPCGGEAAAEQAARGIVGREGKRAGGHILIVPEYAHNVFEPAAT